MSKKYVVSNGTTATAVKCNTPGVTPERVLAAFVKKSPGAGWNIIKELVVKRVVALSKDPQIVDIVTVEVLITTKEDAILRSLQKRFPEKGYVKVAEIHNNEHLCPYCRTNIAKTKCEDILCDECKDMFGHSLYSEL